MASVRPKIPLPLPTQGIRPDVDDFHVPPDALRSTSYNWLLRNGKLVTRPGLADLDSIGTGEVPLGIIGYDSAFTGFTLVVGGTTGWFQYDPGTLQGWHRILSNTGTGNFFNSVDYVPWDFRVFNSSGRSFLIGVNGANVPRAWGSDSAGDDFLALPSAPPARCIAIVSDRVLLGHLLTGPSDPSGVVVSAFQDHTSGWGSVQTATLVETPGFITSMNELGRDRAAVYKTESIYLASGTTGLTPIRFDLHSTNVVGPFNTRTVVPLDQSLHAVFARDHHLYFFDGINYTRHPVSDRVRILYEQNASQESQARLRTHAHYNRTYNELWWFYTRAGLEDVGPREAIVVNLNNNSVWKVDYTNASFSFTASYYGIIPEADPVFSALFPIRRRGQLFGNSVGTVYESTGGLDVTFPIDHLMEQGLTDLGMPTLAKTVEESEHFFGSPTSSQTPSVSVLTSEAGKDATQSAAQSLTVTPTSTGPYVTGHRTTGGDRVTSRFIGMRIEDDSSSEPLEFRGAAITIAQRGNR